MLILYKQIYLNHILPLRVRVDLGVIAMKWDATPTRALELEPHV